jgi:hypothetical protein
MTVEKVFFSAVCSTESPEFFIIYSLKFIVTVSHSQHKTPWLD